MARAQQNKPYSRPDHKSADAPGGWKHDLHAAAAQRNLAGGSSSAGGRLASRLSSLPSVGSGRGKGSDLLSRMSGPGTELLPAGRPSNPRSHSSGNGKMLGWEPNAAERSAAHPNAGLELFPTGGGGTGPMRTVSGGGGGRALGSRIVASGMAAAGLGQSVSAPSPPRQNARGMDVDPPAVSIMGASKVVVRVENLAQGTTAEDVMSAFSPSPITSASLTYPPPPGPLVSVDLEYASKAPAEELILQYNGAVADGNALRLSIVKTGLSERMGNARSPSAASGSSSFGSRIGTGREEGRSEAGRELLSGAAPSKMYSDSILASHPTSSIITLADNSSASRDGNRQRVDAWNAGRSLASRVGR